MYPVNLSRCAGPKGSKPFYCFHGVGLHIDTSNDICTDDKKEAQRGKFARGNIAHESQDQESNPRNLIAEILY